MGQKKTRQIKKLQNQIFTAMLALIVVMTVILSILSIEVNIFNEKKGMDQNLQNIARAIAQSSDVEENISNKNSEYESFSHLDTLKNSLSNIDVISVIDSENVRKYHTNQKLIGTKYNGTMPDFKNNSSLYVTNDRGPSGLQRRAYAQIYDKKGNPAGFVITSMLEKNYDKIVFNTIIFHLSAALIIILCAFFISKKLSKKIKSWLNGYEPDTFSAMFNIRENILESLEEGVVAVDSNENILYMNNAAQSMMNIRNNDISNKKITDISSKLSVKKVLENKDKETGITIHPSNNSDILVDKIPVADNSQIVGALCLMHDRTEYRKIMEDLSGVRYLVESMRANNHDFTNKLHVILGLIQMGRTTEASEYITNITSIQQALIHNIMENIEEPSVAALLIGKYARATELNIKFNLNPDSRYNKGDISVVPEDIVTIIGNLLENSMESLNEKNDSYKELSIGIFTQPHAMMITVDDTGMGISDKNMKHIFENGFSTKGNSKKENRGNGLYLINKLVKKYNGNINVESETGEGTSFTIELTEEVDENV